jgi:hypothetical protein
VIPTFSVIRGDEAGERHGRAHAMQAMRAGEIEKRLVDRDGLDQRCHLQHQLAHGSARFGIFRHVGLDDHRLGAERKRLEHGHRRFHALDAGDVAGGRHHASGAAADDHRPVGEFRPVALFDRRIEGIAVDVRDRKLMQFGVPHKARAAAGCGSGAPHPEGVRSSRGRTPPSQPRYA